jgi:hypothetical protein
LVTPSAHAHHHGLLVETASPIQFGDAESVVVERQHAEQPQPAPSDRRPDRHVVDSQRFRAARHRHGHPRPHFVVDAFRRDHARPHLLGRRFDDALSFDDHHGLRYPTRPSDGGLRVGRPRALIPTVEQRWNLLEQEVGKVARCSLTCRNACGEPWRQPWRVQLAQPAPQPGGRRCIAGVRLADR